jgi:DNA polymerase III subunit epsilon
MTAVRQVFLDTETTGLSADSGDRVVEIGCIEMLNRRLSGRTLHHYLNPERPNHPDAVRVHGLTDDFLADKPRFAAIADELLAFIDGAELIAHNASFDVAFLNEELARLGKGPVHVHVAQVTDSLLMARDFYPGKANSLDALCKRLEVDNSNRAVHGALLDAGLLAEVYIRMTRGQKSLVIEVGDDTAAQIVVDAIDLSSFVLPVLAAAEDEVRAHEAMLADLDKACGGKTVWRVMAMA